MRLSKIAFLSVLALSACGPHEPSHAISGTILGGMGGAALGAGFGNGRTNNVLIGAAAGAVAGAAIGYSMDNHSAPGFAEEQEFAPSHCSCVRTGGEVNYQPMQYTCTDDNRVSTQY